MAQSPETSKKSKRHVVITFGRDVTEEDMQKLRAIADVRAVTDQVDEDHDHLHGG